jgi:hypothetical protein
VRDIAAAQEEDTSLCVRQLGQRQRNVRRTTPTRPEMALVTLMSGV